MLATRLGGKCDSCSSFLLEHCTSESLQAFHPGLCSSSVRIVHSWSKSHLSFIQHCRNVKVIPGKTDVWDQQHLWNGSFSCLGFHALPCLAVGVCLWKVSGRPQGDLNLHIFVVSRSGGLRGGGDPWCVSHLLCKIYEVKRWRNGSLLFCRLRCFSGIRLLGIFFYT